MVDFNWLIAQAVGAFFRVVAAPIATVLAAILGAWFGTGLALTKYKEQAAFDRRCRWYEEMCAVLHEMGGILATGIHHDKRGNTAEAEATFKSLEPLIFKMGKHAAAAELYASIEGVEAVRHLLREINRAGNTIWLLAPFDADGARRMGRLQMHNHTWDAARILAKEFRADMKWDPLPPEQHDPS